MFLAVHFMLCSSCSLSYLQQNISDDSWLPSVTCGGTATQMKIYPGLGYIMVGHHLHEARPMLEPQFEKSRINPGTGSACMPRGTYIKFSELLYGVSHWMVTLHECMQPFWWTIPQVADNSMKEKSLLHFQKAGEGRQ